MRLRASLGGLLLLCSACVALPTEVRVEIDGHSLEFKKPVPPAAPAPTAQAPADNGPR